MKTFSNSNARSPQDASNRSAQARKAGRTAVFAGGGSDVLQLVKERIVQPDVIVNLKTMANLNQITTSAAGVDIGWYYRNGFQCYKNGGNQCFSFAGENQFHAIFGGGPSYIVHPSDTAPALVALGALFTVVGPGGERRVPASDFFVLPRLNPARENVLAEDEMLASIEVPAAKAGTRSRYHKVMDRETWTHAVVSAAVVLEMDQEVCRSARIVLGGVAPIPWRLPEVERMLTGQRITEELAAKASETSVTGARALSKNAYKIPLTRGVVRRAILEARG